MTKIKSLIGLFLATCLFFVVSAVAAPRSLAAPRLYFDPSNTNAPSGSDINVSVKIDVEGNSAFGADAVLIYPSADLTLKSVTNGDFFTDFSNAPSTGSIEIHAFFSSPFQYKTGSGTLATIVFTSKKDNGSNSVDFACNGSGSDTEILNSSGQNILNCSSLNKLTLSYGSVPGEPNFCGGTCGSNYNCQGGLYCYQGFCRNPDCTADTTCGCKPTPKPISKTTPKPTVASTPAVVTLIKYTPTPRGSATPSASPKTGAKSGVSSNAKNIALWAGGIVTAVVLISGITAIFKRKNKPPKINPPTFGSPLPPTPPTTF